MKNRLINESCTITMTLEMWLRIYGAVSALEDSTEKEWLQDAIMAQVIDK